ncbi:MAG: flagellar hook protein FlgE [Armatimonadetes bacterium]|nr:flagellar hook protein FlgE [Armatimonadota bacterium]
MLQAMFAGVSGLQAHQIKLDVIGNNIANVDTTGFKAGRVTFEDQLSQTLRYAAGPNATLGGQNAKQVGLGVTLGAVDTLQTQGNLQSTGKQTDLAIQGGGFFLVSNGSDVSYTRDGSFDLDSEGNLVNPSNGLRLVGYSADKDGKIDLTKALDNSSTIKIPVGTLTAVKATQNANLQGNLNATAPAGTWTTSVKVFDSLGVGHNLTYKFTKSALDATAPAGASSQWGWAVTEGTSPITDSTTSGNSPLYFDTKGALTNKAPITLNLTPIGADPLSVNVDIASISQLAGDSSVTTISQDGFPVGTLQTFAITPNGVVSGIFNNGQTQVLGQVATASFSNPAGLEKLGENLFRVSSNSGLPQVGAAAQNGRGKISTGYTEMSNVDLANEFTNMIITQRGFQANTKIISTVDEMMQEIINLKR